ncbi:MAG: hypothetical protein H7Y30_15535 [Pyrinomonadaceae bacterium]|nr:hypothetical protein [Pyrinomonadaceae bacterium]
MNSNRAKLLALSLMLLCVSGLASFSRDTSQAQIASAPASSDDILKLVAGYRAWTRVNTVPQEVVGATAYG